MEIRRGKGSMERTSLWYPVHWVRDRPAGSLEPFCVVFWGCWLREKICGLRRYKALISYQLELLQDSV